MTLSVIVLAAGQGKRMKSDLPKVLHPLLGRTLLGHVLATVSALNPDRTLVVVGHGAEHLTAHLGEVAPDAEPVVQEEQLGTGHAVRVAVEAAGIAALLDAVLSVDAVRLYKPRPEVYALVTDAFACKPEEVAFVSSNRWDVMGAAAFGFRPLWVNRAKMPEEYAELPPVQAIADLGGLASLAL